MTYLKYGDKHKGDLIETISPKRQRLIDAFSQLGSTPCAAAPQGRSTARHPRRPHNLTMPVGEEYERLIKAGLANVSKLNETELKLFRLRGGGSDDEAIRQRTGVAASSLASAMSRINDHLGLTCFRSRDAKRAAWGEIYKRYRRSQAAAT